MQPLKIFGEWEVAVEFLNGTPDVVLPFDVGMFSSIGFLLLAHNKKYIVASWHGCMEDLLDSIVAFSKQPEHPNLVVEVRYENPQQRLAGTLTAANGQYRTSMELRTTDHSDAYEALHKGLCLDCLQQSLDPDVFTSGINNAQGVADAAIAQLHPRMTEEHFQNATALEFALAFASEGLKAVPPKGTPEHERYMRAYTNAAVRLQKVLDDLGLSIFKFPATVTAALLFPTVGGRLLGAMRDAQLRRYNQPIAPAPPKPPTPPQASSEFSDSFPL